MQQNLIEKTSTDWSGFVLKTCLYRRKPALTSDFLDFFLRRNRWSKGQGRKKVFSPKMPKRSSEASQSVGLGTTPETVLAFLLGSPDETFSWSEPKVMRAPQGGEERFSSLFSQTFLESIVKKSGGSGIEHGTHLRVVKAEGSHRVEFGEPGKPLSSKDLKKHFEQGRTVQFFSPQHHVDHVCEILSNLEARLQCLCGASVYMTPPGVQGLAPHWDDVDVFILQCEGEKSWTLHQPFEVHPLSPSGDLDESRIVGEPILEVTLRPGDCLYMPRGVIHQAKTTESNSDCGAARVLPFSTHVTISTHQRWRVAELLEFALAEALKSAASDPENTPLRETLPAGCLGYTGSAFGTAPGVASLCASPKVTSARQGIFEKVRAAAALVLERMDATCVDGAADLLSDDFLANRLPPFPLFSSPGTYPSSSKKSKQATEQILVRFVHPGHIRLVVEPPGSEDEDDEGELLVLFAHGNDRKSHMKGGNGGKRASNVSLGEDGGQSDTFSDDEEDDEDEGLVVRLDYGSAPFVLAIHSAGKKWTAVPREAENTASQLHEKGLLEIRK